MNRYLLVLVVSLSGLCACSTSSNVDASANFSRTSSSSARAESPSSLKTECPHLDTELQKILNRENGVRTATLLVSAMTFLEDWETSGKSPNTADISLSRTSGSRRQIRTGGMLSAGSS